MVSKNEDYHNAKQLRKTERTSGDEQRIVLCVLNSLCYGWKVMFFQSFLILRVFCSKPWYSLRYTLMASERFAKRSQFNLYEFVFYFPPQ